MFRKLMRGEGFTLIELLAVMSIVAVLAGIIAVAVSGSGETSRDTQTVQDGTSIETAVADFFGEDFGVTSTTQVYSTADGFTPADTVLGVTITTTSAEVKSTAFPETFITDTYSTEFQGDSTAVNGVTKVILLDEDGIEQSDFAVQDLLAGFTAISFTLLEDNFFLTSEPNSVTKVSKTDLGTGTDFEFHNFLWLLEKDTAAGSTGTVSSRNVAVYKLTEVDIAADGKTVELTYRRIF